jgi:alkylated DNA repair dioxygenase AlkB
VRPLADTAFNSALLNWYRNGQDSVDWHSDDERELGANPVIASLSLGATRRFDLRQRRDKSHRVSLDLGHGSLLLMKGALQHHWHHRLPKQAGITGDRINITFRLVKVLSPGTSPLQT